MGRWIVILGVAAGLLAGCARPGYHYEVGDFFTQTPNNQGMHGTQAAPVAVAARGNESETYEQDKVWSDRIAHGACTRLRNRYTDSPTDIADCNRDYAMTPMCISYKGFASAWYDMANDPNPAVSSPAFAMTNLNNLGAKGQITDPPYYQDPQFREALHRLLNVAFSSNRVKWGTRDKFADYAYKSCMERHPF